MNDNKISSIAEAIREMEHVADISPLSMEQFECVVAVCMAEIEEAFEEGWKAHEAHLKLKGNMQEATQPAAGNDLAKVYEANLENRVHLFNTLNLPSQPLAMHMGTYVLVNDLWREVQRLRGGKLEVKS